MGYLDDLYSSALEGLGIDTGENAAKTIGKVYRAQTAEPAPASNLPVSASVTPAFEVEDKTKLYLGIGAAVIAAILLLGD